MQVQIPKNLPEEALLMRGGKAVFAPWYIPTDEQREAVEEMNKALTEQYPDVTRETAKKR